MQYLLTGLGFSSNMCKQNKDNIGNVGPGVGDLLAFIHRTKQAQCIQTCDSFGHAMLSRGLHLVDATFSSSRCDGAPTSPPLTSLPLQSPVRCGVTVSHGTGEFSPSEKSFRPWWCDLDPVSGELCQRATATHHHRLPRFVPGFQVSEKTGYCYRMVVDFNPAGAEQ
jgi:hypothetical protein